MIRGTELSMSLSRGFCAYTLGSAGNDRRLLWPCREGRQGQSGSGCLVRGHSASAYEARKGANNDASSVIGRMAYSHLAALMISVFPGRNDDQLRQSSRKGEPGL